MHRGRDHGPRAAPRPGSGLSLGHLGAPSGRRSGAGRRLSSSPPGRAAPGTRCAPAFDRCSVPAGASPAHSPANAPSAAAIAAALISVPIIPPRRRSMRVVRTVGCSSAPAVRRSQAATRARRRRPGSLNRSAEPSDREVGRPGGEQQASPATPSRRCHGVSRLVCAASAAPMKVVPSAGSASANAAACSCQASSNAGLGSARSPADSTTPIHRTA